MPVSTYNPNPGIIQTLAHNVLTRLPLVGPAYNLINTGVHAAEGSLNQHGPAPSLIGRLIQWASGNNGIPTAGSIAPPAPAPYAGGFTFNPNALPYDQSVDPSNPGAYGLPGQGSAPTQAQQQNQSGLGPGGIPLSVWQQVYNTGRFTNAPAFSPTLAQTLFPGSRIGPGGSSVANPYDPSSTHGTPNSVVTSIPPSAAAFMNWVRSRNQI